MNIDNVILNAYICDIKWLEQASGTMIKNITFTNFFSFASQSVDLRDINILLGINGSGKSNFMKAFQILRAIVAEGELQNLFLNRWGGFDSVCFAGSKAARPRIVIEYEFDPLVFGRYGYKFQESVFYRIKFCKVGSSQNYYVCEQFYTKQDNGRPKYVYFKINNGQGYVREGKTDSQQEVEYTFENTSDSVLTQLVDKDRFYQVHTLREALRDIVVYSGFDTSFNSAIRKPSQPGNSLKLSPDGSNLPQLINRIKINSKSDYNRLVDSFVAINPMVKGFDFNIIGNNLELLLDETGLERSIHISNISDGTLRYLCLLAVFCNRKRGGLICVDEPESGLHPDMISELLEVMNDTTDKTQYVLATHSQHLLNGVSVEDVLVFEKDEGNSSVVNSFDDPDYVEWASQYATGTLWRNGDLGGNRY